MKILLLALVCLFAFASAQIHNSNIKPKSLLIPVQKSVHTINLPKVDLKTAMAEEKKDAGLDVAPRYGIPHFVRNSIHNAGTFQTFKDGSRMWRLKYRTEGAYFTTIAFDKFKLARDATLHIIQKSGKFLGAFTEKNNKKDNTFAAGPMEGDEFTLELFEPVHSVGKSEINVQTVVHSYKDLFKYKNGRSGTCNINVACEQGEGWEGQIAGVALLLQASGFRFCTGSLINNLKKDGTPYFLTAAHCGTTPNTWIAMFNYQGSTCTRGSPSRTTDTLSGFDTVAINRVSDFHLMKLREEIPTSYKLYLSGFSALDDAEQGTSVGIHHPSGDNKKIAVCSTPLTHSRWSGGPANTHWRVNRWAEGTTEPGSSGSPLFDSQKRIVGQLHGGTASCRNPSGWDVYGKIYTSWTGNDSKSRLKDHLDPENTGETTCEGSWFNDLKK